MRYSYTPSADPSSTPNPAQPPPPTPTYGHTPSASYSAPPNPATNNRYSYQPPPPPNRQGYPSQPQAPPLPTRPSHSSRTSSSGYSPVNFDAPGSGGVAPELFYGSSVASFYRCIAHGSLKTNSFFYPGSSMQITVHLRSCLVSQIRFSSILTGIARSRVLEGQVW